MQYETFPKISRPKNHIFFCILYTNMNIYHISSQYPIPCPTMVKKFCTKKRRIVISHLGVILYSTLSTVWCEALEHCMRIKARA